MCDEDLIFPLANFLSISDFAFNIDYKCCFDPEKTFGKLVAEKYGKDSYILNKFPLAVSCPPPASSARHVKLTSA